MVNHFIVALIIWNDCLLTWRRRWWWQSDYAILVAKFEELFGCRFVDAVTRGRAWWFLILLIIQSELLLYLYISTCEVALTCASSTSCHHPRLLVHLYLSKRHFWFIFDRAPTIAARDWTWAYFLVQLLEFSWIGCEWWARRRARTWLRRELKQGSSADLLRSFHYGDSFTTWQNEARRGWFCCASNIFLRLLIRRTLAHSHQGLLLHLNDLVEFWRFRLAMAGSPDSNKCRLRLLHLLMLLLILG